jgi:DNA-binding CsgD family transcriptional regulator
MRTIRTLLGEDHRRFVESLAARLVREPDREVCRWQFLSRHKVRTHPQNVLGKLSAHAMLEAVSLARQSGMRPGVG